jgi:histidinol-phosphate phosphatase family protein
MTTPDARLGDAPPGETPVGDALLGDPPVRDPATRYTVVIPTIGRSSLIWLLDAVTAAAADGNGPEMIIVVDDRPEQADLVLPHSSVPLVVVCTEGRGPAAARNAGWRLALTEWVAFLDDDVMVRRDWCLRLVADLAALPPDVAGSQAQIRVPMPDGRRPTDEERRTTGLAGAQWITADMAYRRSVLQLCDGFDERFPRAFREDSDLALRMVLAGFRVVRGMRETDHPLRPGSWTGSIRAQAGNADNALLRAKYGRHWRRLIAERPGRLGPHLATTAAAAAMLVTVARRSWRAAGVAAAVWTLLTAEFAVRRAKAGPRTARELAAVAATSAVIPPAAVLHRARGAWKFRSVAPVRVKKQERGPTSPRRSVSTEAVEAATRAVLFDRDGTLIVDVPYLADAAAVQPVPGALEVVQDLRARDIRIGVVSNQSGVAKGLISNDQLAEVNARVDALLGPFDTWQLCPHDAGQGCDCRKPLPGMVLQAAQQLGVDVADCVLIGDAVTDAEAALAAGAQAVLVMPTVPSAPDLLRLPAGVPLASTLSEAVALAVGRPR